MLHLHMKKYSKTLVNRKKTPQSFNCQFHILECWSKVIKYQIS